MSAVRVTTGVAAIALAAAGPERDRRDLRRQRQRLGTVERSVIETPFGRVEYADR